MLQKRKKSGTFQTCEFASFLNNAFRIMYVWAKSELLTIVNCVYVAICRQKGTY